MLFNSTRKKSHLHYGTASKARKTLRYLKKSQWVNKDALLNQCISEQNITPNKLMECGTQ